MCVTEHVAAAFPLNNEKNTPFGVNLTRSLVTYQAAGKFPLNKVTRQGQTYVSCVGTNLGCIAVRKSQNKVMGIGQLSRLLHFFLSQQDYLSELAGQQKKSCSSAFKAVDYSTLHIKAIYHSTPMNTCSGFQQLQPHAWQRS